MHGSFVNLIKNSEALFNPILHGLFGQRVLHEEGMLTYLTPKPNVMETENTKLDERVGVYQNVFRKVSFELMTSSW